MKRLTILGSTGSIGRNTLEIVAMFPQRFSVTALTAKTGTALLAEQILRFQPKLAAVIDHYHAEQLASLLPVGFPLEIVYGEAGYRAAAVHAETDIVVTAVVGAAGLMPTLAAIEHRKHIALANKETLVMAGEIVMGLAVKHGVQIMPVDSEHSAIFQCLAGSRREDLDKIIITASGGPFFKRPDLDLSTIRPQDALKHPNWSMGRKITIDSATMMNKGLEVIEARWLFDLPAHKIEVLVHPQSIVHSMVVFQDGSVMAQLGVPDMKSAIALALSWPQRLPLKQPIPNFISLKSLDFYPPDMIRFPCLPLAFKALEIGGTLPAVLNAANEAAVAAFLEGRLAFTDIPNVIADTMEHLTVCQQPTIEDIIAADRQAFRYCIKQLD